MIGYPLDLYRGQNLLIWAPEDKLYSVPRELIFYTTSPGLGRTIQLQDLPTGTQPRDELRAVFDHGLYLGYHIRLRTGDDPENLEAYRI